MMVEPPKPSTLVRVTPLGAGCEVGRSCILVEFKERSILFDCGVHPAHSGVGALPFFDAIEARTLAKVDLCLVTHFHLDHCGSVPYLVSKTAFKGQVKPLALQLMTPPTLALARILWLDYANMAKISSENEFTTERADTARPLFDATDINSTLKKVRTLSFRQRIVFDELGITVTAYPAGHVIGACMFVVEIEGVRVMYTGDFSREVERYVPVAEVPQEPIHVLICEGTYGIRCHENRLARENRFLAAVRGILRRNGKCLMPVFALGRVQELLLMLEECWEAHPQLQDIPIFYASPMSQKSLPVLEACVSSCGDYVKKLADDGKNPFVFKHVKIVRHIDDFRESATGERPCVVLASPGMLQSGTSRALFREWCGDRRNGVILTGYAVKGTLADDLKSKPPRVELDPEGPPVPVLSSFDMVSFSAHSDFEQTFDFVKQIRCPNVVLVHGERNQIKQLGEKLKLLHPSLATFTPELLQSVELHFDDRTEKEITLLGSLAEMADLKPVQETVLVVSEKGKTPRMLLPSELAKYYTEFENQIVTMQYAARMQLPLAAFRTLVEKVDLLFNHVAWNESTLTAVVEDNVAALTYDSDKNEVLLLWSADPYAELIADAITYAALELPD